MLPVLPLNYCLFTVYLCWAGLVRISNMSMWKLPHCYPGGNVSEVHSTTLYHSSSCLERAFKALIFFIKVCLPQLSVIKRYNMMFEWGIWFFLNVAIINSDISQKSNFNLRLSNTFLLSAAYKSLILNIAGGFFWAPYQSHLLKLSVFWEEEWAFLEARWTGRRGRQWEWSWMRGLVANTETVWPKDQGWNTAPAPIHLPCLLVGVIYSTALLESVICTNEAQT